MGLGTCLAPFIFLESGLKPRKTQAWRLLPPGEVKVRGFTIRACEPSTSQPPPLSPLPSAVQGEDGVGEGSAGSRDRGSKVWKQDGLPPQGAHSLGKSQPDFGHRAKPHLLRTEVPSTRNLARALSQLPAETAKPTRPPAAASVLTWCPKPTPIPAALRLPHPSPRPTVHIRPA